MSTRKQAPGQGMTADLGSAIKRQVQEVGTVAVQAVASRAWLYPVQGVIYLISHPALLRPLIPTLLKGGLLSLAVIAGLFTLTYLPQVAVLAFVSGPLAFLAAIPLILGEAYVLINFLARTFLFDRVGVDLFDAVLLQKGQAGLLERGRQIQSSGSKRQLGRVLGKPFAKLGIDNIARYLLTLPLNFIPVVGTAFFLGYNGYKSGPGYHSRYFQLKNYDKPRREAYIKQQRGQYTGFGISATLLNLVPIASIFFTCSSTVGAALMASDMENARDSNVGKKAE